MPVVPVPFGRPGERFFAIDELRFMVLYFPDITELGRWQRWLLADMVDHGEAIEATRARRPDAATLQRLAKIAGISEAKCPWWSDRVVWRIEVAHLPIESWSWYAGEVAKPLVRIARVDRELLQALTVLEKDDRIGVGARTQFQATLMQLTNDLDWVIERKDPRTGKSTYADWLTRFEEQLHLLEQVAMAAAEAAKRDLRKRGRPADKKHPGRARFITAIALDTLKAGGQLTLDKRAETGSLICLLNALRPFLPRGFVPPREKHPVSSYGRALQEAKVAFAAHGASRP
jgi:hypothetical protein